MEPMKRTLSLLFLSLFILTCSQDLGTKVSGNTAITPHILWKTAAGQPYPDAVDSVRITITSPDLPNSLINTFAFGDNQGSFTKLASGITIIVTAQGIDSLGNVTWHGSVGPVEISSAVFDITIEAGMVTPIAPSQVVAQTLSHNSIRLIWNENSTNETYYLIQRQTNGSTTWDSIGTATQNVFTDSSLTPVTQYQYKVTAANGAGRSVTTPLASATTLLLDKTGPLVTISAHKKIDTVSTRTVTLYGTARDTSGIYQVMINDVVAQLNADQWMKQNYYLIDTTNTIVVKATDNSPLRNFTLDTVTLVYKSTYVDTTNHAPVFTVTGDTMKATIKVGQNYEKVLRVFDVDANDTLRFVVSSPLSLLGKDTISWKPRIADVGIKACYALVYDKKQARDSIGWAITVLDSAAQIPNHPPIFVTEVTSIPDSVGPNKAYGDTLAASDEDAGQQLTFSILSGPAGLTIGSTTGIVAWTPTATGTFPVTARVTDDSTAHADIGWTITVAVTPKAPGSPTISSATAGDGLVTVSWGSVQGATSYNLYYKAGTTVDIATGTKIIGVTSPKIVSGLPNGTQYAFAVSAVNGVGEGNLSAVTPAKPEVTGSDLWIVTGTTLTDPDNNTYTTVTIGNQVWTVENLKTTKYNNGLAITYVPDSLAWYNLYTSSSTMGAYCYYENNAANWAKYGALYNWYAVNTGKLAPVGWHVPTDADWDTLQNYLIAKGYNWDGTTTGNKIAKSLAAKTDWSSYTFAGTIGNDLGKNNASGFSALPGGYRYCDGYFIFQSYIGYWWSATEIDPPFAFYRYLYYNYESLYRYSDGKGCGFSVRLLRDLN
jgi:uncharacterized protein (TIGR02145 family)